ncbi:DUF4333 domain-containing protein [Streptomyces sp. ATE26]|uniref:DUF4333 domain-containing protein n=1 Tax=unclassified Streptomyces TaxID=2593676 RepID=UPI001173EAE2|nr:MULTISPECIES: DUF4333 domain-containing protein [unclassified Streptomyces]MDI1457154.1 DUF4333 domain-containing protein [Streptomyces sp. ATE26]GEK04633.1 hypothetical protein TNCT1_69090 [Streptomyces sp. 1-11]
MPKFRRSAAVSAFSAVTVGVLLSGCSASVSVGTPKLSAGKLASTLSAKLAATTGRPKPHITCPEDLKGKVGTTTRCTLSADDGSTLGITVKVTSVEDGKINFDYKADDKVSPAAG